MPIEIKELVVKFNVTDNKNTEDNNQISNPVYPNYKKLVKDCTEKVIKQLERKIER